MSNAPSGWQPDPSGRHELRFWDGTTWTDQVADGGVSSSDPIGPSGEQTSVAPGPPGGGDQVPSGGQPWAPPGGGSPGEPSWTTPGGAPAGGHMPSPAGGMPPARTTRVGPSTGLLAGLGIVVVGLAVAIGVLLMNDSGGGDNEVEATSDTQESPDTTGSGTTGTTATGDTPGTTEAIEDMDAEELAEEAPTGLESEIDAMVADFQGEIDEDDAVCMMQEATAEGIRRDLDLNTGFNSLPTEDQAALMFAMLDNCVDIDQVMANLIAGGMTDGDPTITEEQADCAGSDIVDTVGARTIIDAIAAAGQYGNPLDELSDEDEIAAQDAVVACLAGESQA